MQYDPETRLNHNAAKYRVRKFMAQLDNHADKDSVELLTKVTKAITAIKNQGEGQTIRIKGRQCNLTQLCTLMDELVIRLETKLFN